MHDSREGEALMENGQFERNNLTLRHRNVKFPGLLRRDISELHPEATTINKTGTRTRKVAEP